MTSRTVARRGSSAARVPGGARAHRTSQLAVEHLGDGGVELFLREIQRPPQRKPLAIVTKSGYGSSSGPAPNRCATVAIVETIFPLNHHAEVLIVQEQHFHGQLLAVGTGQFLDVYEETTVTVNINDGLVRMSHQNTMAAGKPKPMVPRPPLVSQVRGA